MMTRPYGFGVTLPKQYEQVLPRVKEALKAEQFGVLTEIDVGQTLQEKLGVQMPPYLILGVCNPQLAHRALELEPEIGLLLPCNVVVRAVEDGCRIEIADPEVMLSMVGKEQLDAVACEAKERLQRAVAVLER